MTERHNNDLLDSTPKHRAGAIASLAFFAVAIVIGVGFYFYPDIRSKLGRGSSNAPAAAAVVEAPAIKLSTLEEARWMPAKTLPVAGIPGTACRGTHDRMVVVSVDANGTLRWNDRPTEGEGRATSMKGTDARIACSPSGERAVIALKDRKGVWSASVLTFGDGKFGEWKSIPGGFVGTPGLAIADDGFAFVGTAKDRGPMSYAAWLPARRAWTDWGNGEGTLISEMVGATLSDRPLLAGLGTEGALYFRQALTNDSLNVTGWTRVSGPYEKMAAVAATTKGGIVTAGRGVNGGLLLGSVGQAGGKQNEVSVSVELTTTPAVGFLTDGRRAVVAVSRGANIDAMLIDAASGEVTEWATVDQGKRPVGVFATSDGFQVAYENAGGRMAVRRYAENGTVTREKASTN